MCDSPRGQGDKRCAGWLLSYEGVQDQCNLQNCGETMFQRSLGDLELLRMNAEPQTVSQALRVTADDG